MKESPFQPFSEPMESGKRSRLERGATWLLSGVTLALMLFAFWGVGGVPFHPDESTQLFMSHDFDLLFSDPLSLAWSPEQGDDLRTHYRLVDAPLTRYLLGLGRTLAGQPALPADWDWSKSWEQNCAAGALPDPALLITGRLAGLMLLPLSLILIFLIGRGMHSPLTGLASAALLASHALVLLHGRRAMAEAALTFSLLLAVWCFTKGSRRPWLAGLGLGLAFSTKQTLLALFPVGLIAISLPSPGGTQASRKPNLRQLGWAGAQYLGAFLLVCLALNPFLWRHPIQAAQAAWAERQDLQSRQTSDALRLSPETALDTPVKRLAALLAHLYFTPPKFAETANYLEYTQTTEQAYRINPVHTWLRGMAGGSLMLILNLAGCLIALLRLRHEEPVHQQILLILLLASLFQFAALLLWMPLPWQRYVMPLAPLSCLWTAYALTIFVKREQ